MTGTLAAGAHPGSYNGQDAYSDMLIPFVKAKRAQTDSDDETWEADRPNPTINQFDHGDSRATTAIVFHPHYWDGARPQTEDTSPTVTARWGTGGNNGLMVANPDLAVRRLTPLECERLMGWPDNHTLHRKDGKHNSDSTRYRMCGNGVVAPVAQWIAKHLHNTLTDD